MNVRDACPARHGTEAMAYGSFVPGGLVARVTPFPDESLASLVQRAAALNGYSTVGDILLQAGFLRQHPGAISRSADKNAACLARTLNVVGGAEGIGRLQTPAIPGRAGWRDFFGTPVRELHHEWKVRRVSPRGLRESLHVRAVWSLRPLCFDPATKETLLDACPECHRSLNFFGSRGVQFCDRCTRRDKRGFVHGAVDLRDFPQPIIEIADVEALDFLTGLVDPGAIGWTTRHSLHDDLKGFDRGTIFELGLALSSAITADPKRVPGSGDPIRTVSDYMRLSPDVLARAGRALLSWPRGIQDLAEEVRSSAHLRGGRFGLAKEFGPLLALQRSRLLEPAVRAAMRRAISDGIRMATAREPSAQRKGSLSRSDLITSTQAGKLLRCSAIRFIQMAQKSGIALTRAEASQSGPVLVARRELQPILEERLSVVPQTYAAKAFGLSVACVERLAQRRLFSRALAYEQRWSVTRPYYERGTVDACIASLRAATQKSEPPSSSSTLYGAVRSSGLFSPDPWGDAFEAILTGRLKAWIREDGGLPLAQALAVEGPDALRSAVSRSNDAISDASVVDRQQAAVVLGVKAEIVRWLEADGLIPVPTTIGSLRSFSRRYVHTSDAYRWIREIRTDINPSTIADFLKDSGLDPAANVTPRGRYLWHRDEVAALVEALRRSSSPTLCREGVRSAASRQKQVESVPESRVSVGTSRSELAGVDSLVAL